MFNNHNNNNRRRMNSNSNECSSAATRWFHKTSSIFTVAQTVVFADEKQQQQESLPQSTTIVKRSGSSKPPVLPSAAELPLPASTSAAATFPSTLSSSSNAEQQQSKAKPTANGGLKRKEDGSVHVPWKKMFAGAVAGIADVWACHGLDRIKTHMQQHHGQSIRQATREILDKGGIRSLYEGILPMTLEAVVKVGLRYFSFEYFKEEWRVHVQKSSDPNAHLSLTGSVLGGAFAGIIESACIVIPCELLKVRHMTQTQNESFYTVFRNVLQHEGIRGLYKGGTSTMLRQVTNMMVRFPIFYTITNYIKDVRGDQHVPFVYSFTVGAFAGMCSTLVNTPLDTIKTRQQRQGQKGTLTDIVKGIYRDGGVKAFWSGTIPRVIRVAPGQAITFAVYEVVAELIGKD